MDPLRSNWTLSLPLFLRLLLFNSVFSPDSGDSADHAESCGLDRVPTACVYVCVWVHAWNAHTLQNMDAGNGGGREWGEMKGKWGFFYRHSLSSRTHTPCMHACWCVSNTLCECCTWHHSFCHAKHCRIITVSLCFPLRAAASQGFVSLSTKLHWFKIQQTVDLFVWIMNRAFLFLYFELRSSPTAESLRERMHKWIINSPQPRINHSYLEQIGFQSLFFIIILRRL